MEARFPHLPELDSELEKFWLTIKEDEFNAEQFRKKMVTVSSLNTVCILVIAIALFVLLSTLKGESMKGIPNG